MLDKDVITEATRQIGICNACRYCEGYCSVFPSMFRERAFDVGQVTQLANLCHNCRGCYYACQYTEPHEFALNLPAALAEVRSDTWQTCAWPQGLGTLFHRHGVAFAAVLILAIAAIFLLAQGADGVGFYAYLSHAAMVAIFVPAFVLPLGAVAVGLRTYWRLVGGNTVRLPHIVGAVRHAATLRDLSGGQGQGCNFEDGDRFTNRRRWAHQMVLYGFLLCFAATVSGTILHYVFAAPAPYGFFSLPKLLGLPGGVLLTIGAVWLIWLKAKSDPELGDRRVWGGEFAFVGVLGLTGATGLGLYAATGTGLVQPLLALHLGTVLTFFVTTPYSKMAHGFYRLAALIRNEQITQG